MARFYPVNIPLFYLIDLAPLDFLGFTAQFTKPRASRSLYFAWSCSWKFPLPRGYAPPETVPALGFVNRAVNPGKSRSNPRKYCFIIKAFRAQNYHNTCVSSILKFAQYPTQAPPPPLPLVFVWSMLKFAQYSPLSPPPHTHTTTTPVCHQYLSLPSTPLPPTPQGCPHTPLPHLCVKFAQ